MVKFKFIDLFAGIGGLRVGFSETGGQCVFTSEWDKFAQQTYRANFGEGEKIFGDITKIDEADIPEHDILLGGFPCQPFSIAGVSKKNSLGKNHGFLDKTQGTLFFDVARILRHHRPKAFLLENVKNLISHDKGNTFATICDVLEKLGYRVNFSVISSEHWVPQRRKRIFIVGIRDDLNKLFDFGEVEIPSSQPKLSQVLHPEDGSEEEERPFTIGSKAIVSDKYLLSQKLWEYLKSYSERHKSRGNGFGFGLFGPNDIARTLSARYYKDGAEILIRTGKETPRRLTPRECSRLMGFENIKKNSKWVIPVSDTQAYKQFGNAVCPHISKAIARALTQQLF